MLLPLAIFLVVAVFLYRGLYLDPAELPSAMIDKPFPEFSLPAVQGDKTLTRPTFWANRRWSTCGAPGAFPAGSSTRC
jgi:hypothetical protein